MIVTIQIDTAEKLSEKDFNLLVALAGINEPLPASRPNTPTPVVEVQVDEADKGTPEAETVESTPEVRAETVKAEEGTTCPECGETFSSARGLKSHITRSHKDAPKPALASVPENREDDEEPTNESEYVADEDDVTVLREKAVKIATEMVAAGKAAEVRKVLNEIGVRRVSEIADADLSRFLTAVA